jgi:hypothetical protein
LAGCFTALCLLTMAPGAVRGSRLALAGLCAAAALFSVEPALPLLVYPFVLGATLLYLGLRVAALGGMGGYRSDGGESLHLSLGVGRTLRYLGEAFVHLVVPGPWDGADGVGTTALVATAGTLALVGHMLVPIARADARMLVGLLVCIGAALAVTAGWATLGADLSGVRYLYIASMFWCVGLAWSMHRAPRGSWRRPATTGVLGALVLVQLLVLRDVNARWSASGELARAAVDGIVVRVRERGSRHLMLYGAPAAFRGAHALPWGVEQAAWVFARRDLGVDIIAGEDQFAAVQRAHAVADPQARVGVEVGRWDGATRTWIWQ